MDNNENKNHEHKNNIDGIIDMIKESFKEDIDVLININGESNDSTDNRYLKNQIGHPKNKSDTINEFGHPENKSDTILGNILKFQDFAKEIANFNANNDISELYNSYDEIYKKLPEKLEDHCIKNSRYNNNVAQPAKNNYISFLNRVTKIHGMLQLIQELTNDSKTENNNILLSNFNHTLNYNPNFTYVSSSVIDIKILDAMHKEATIPEKNMINKIKVEILIDSIKKRSSYRSNDCIDSKINEIKAQVKNNGNKKNAKKDAYLKLSIYETLKKHRNNGILMNPFLKIEELINQLDKEEFNDSREEIMKTILPGLELIGAASIAINNNKITKFKDIIDKLLEFFDDLILTINLYKKNDELNKLIKKLEHTKKNLSNVGKQYNSNNNTEPNTENTNSNTENTNSNTENTEPAEDTIRKTRKSM